MEAASKRESVSQHYSGFDQLFIDGEWRPGKGDKILQDRNPYTGDIIVEVKQGNREDLEAAYVGAAKAEIEWAAKLPSERAAIMRRAAEIMEERRNEIVSWLIKESGSTQIKANLEWETSHYIMLEASTLTYMSEGRILQADVPGMESRVYRKPVGVVGVISPWNWPLHLSARSVAPALAVGNTVVLKPASDTPVTGGLLLAKIFEEAGLPPGALSVIIGSGSEIGDAFVSHAIPRVISFTGSTPVGRNIAKLAAEASIIKRVELELGGNSPFVVLDDADLDKAVEAGVFGKFLHQGQICMSINRFIIDDSIYDEFVDRFTERVIKLKYGNPDLPNTLVGPIINENQLIALLRRIKEGIDAGANLMIGGEPEGLVLPPHVFTEVTNQMKIAREELFGPIALIIRANGEEDALRIANDTEFGLSGSVFTSDLERGARFAQRIESGMVHVNDQPVNDLPYNPFGGEKNSGIGRFNGAWAVEAFTTHQWVTLQHTPHGYPFDAREVKGPWAGG